MDLDYLNPLPVEVRIDGDLYDLAPVSLRAVQWIDEHFRLGSESGTDAFDRVLKQREKGHDEYLVFTHALCELIFYLLIDSPFPSICIFKNTIRDAAEGPSAAISHLYMAVTMAFYNAEPTRHAAPAERASPAEPSRTEDVPVLPDWAEIYTRFAVELNYTIDQFYDLTYRQVDVILKSLNNIRMREFRFQAELHNQRIENSAQNTTAPSKTIFTPSEDKAAEAEALKLFQELQNKSKVNLKVHGE